MKIGPHSVGLAIDQYTAGVVWCSPGVGQAGILVIDSSMIKNASNLAFWLAWQDLEQSDIFRCICQGMMDELFCWTGRIDGRQVQIHEARQVIENLS